MKVLVVGGGGREHAIVRALARSPQRAELLCAPGNAGIGEDAQLVAVAADDADGLVEAIEREDVDLTVVGPEAPLVAGLVDRLQARGRAAFGPTAAAARLEGSKAFAKQAMEQAGVPTAKWQRVQSLDEGVEAVKQLRSKVGVVVKADGLAAGKGVTVAEDEAEAIAALRDIFGERDASAIGAPAAVIEERLAGEELSLLAICDGLRALPLAPARDYKRIFDGDKGPNTGGMGSFSPVPGIDEATAAEIASKVHQPIVDLMRGRGTPFAGVLYAGLMLTADGVKVLEFNVRFGDPETQAVLPRLRSDLLALLSAASKIGGLREAGLIAAGLGETGLGETGLGETGLEWTPATAVTIVLASAGYPQSASKGDEISGLEQVAGDIEITHAGTVRRDGHLLTAGGRVLGVTALGDDQASARAAAYAAAARISFDGMQLRADIALETADSPLPT